ncbi:collagen alpha-6(VI) chain [Biomphalaria glabrata]|nr:collagen alpha-6(VI) chain-like [Biomphalaria glabrata]
MARSNFSPVHLMCEILILLSLCSIRASFSIESKNACPPMKLDLVIIVDTSTSLTENNFTLVLDFIEKILRLLPIGPDNVRVALVRSSMKARIVSYLNDRMNQDEKIKDVFKIELGYEVTYTSEALGLTSHYVLREVKGDRPDVQDMIILITDGKLSFPFSTKREAEKLKRKTSLKILTILITESIDVSRLIYLASGQDMLLKMDSFTELNRHLDQLKPVVCSGGTQGLASHAPMFESTVIISSTSTTPDDTKLTHKISSSFTDGTAPTLTAATDRQDPAALLSSTTTDKTLTPFRSVPVTKLPPSISDTKPQYPSLSDIVKSTSSVILNTLAFLSTSILNEVQRPATSHSETVKLPSTLYIDAKTLTPKSNSDAVKSPSTLITDTITRTSKSNSDAVKWPSTVITDTVTLTPKSTSDAVKSPSTLITDTITRTSKSNSDAVKWPSTVITDTVTLTPKSTSDAVKWPSTVITDTVTLTPKSTSDAVKWPSTVITDTVTLTPKSTSDAVKWPSTVITDTVTLTPKSTSDAVKWPSTVITDTVTLTPKSTSDAVKWPSTVITDTVTLTSKSNSDAVKWPSTVITDTVTLTPKSNSDEVKSPSTLITDTKTLTPKSNSDAVKLILPCAPITIDSLSPSSTEGNSESVIALNYQDSKIALTINVKHSKLAVNISIG